MNEQHPAGVLFFPPRGSGEPAPGEREALEAAARAAEAGRTLDEILERFWEATSGLLPRDRVSLAFLEEDGARLTTRYCKAAYEPLALDDGYSAGLAGSTLAALLERRQGRLIPDLEAYLAARPRSGSSRLLLKEGVASSLALPLLVGERPVGVLFLSSRTPRAFTAAQGRLLHELTLRLAPALEKAWIIRRLEQARANFHATLGFVSHELKSPLAGLISRGSAYLEGYLGPVDPRAGETVGAMVRGARHMLDMVHNYLDLSRLESGELALKLQDDVRLSELLSAVVDLTAANAEQRGSKVALKLPDLEILLRADPELLQTALLNLVDNGLKYGREGTEVSVEAAVEEDHLVLTVENEGVGFTPEQAARLFRRFSRLRQPGTEGIRGSGLGLYLAWWVAQKHGGTIEAASEPGRWARFSVRIPRGGPRPEGVPG